MTKIKLQLILDVCIYLFIEKWMIVGISYIAKGFNKGNNKYMQSFDDKKLSKYIMHLDANNLWGWTITQYLACGGFKWLDKKKLIIFNNDYPLAPEKLELSHNMLPNYCSNIANK